MHDRLKVKRDYYAGGLMMLLGVGAAVTGAGYKLDPANGSGFMPVMLGIALAFIGILIAGTALASSEPEQRRERNAQRGQQPPHWASPTPRGGQHQRRTPSPSR